MPLSKKQSLINRQFEEWQEMMAKILTATGIKGK